MAAIESYNFETDPAGQEYERVSRFVPSFSQSRREFMARLGKTLAASPLLGLATLATSCGGPAPTNLETSQLTDDEFLDAMQRAIFLFFWEQTSPSTGQIKDRALASGFDTRNISSISATGFGLTALCIADQRGYKASASILARVKATLSFLLQMPHENGFFYHFVDMNSGERLIKCEVSSIDTAILMCGVLTCRQHFQDQQVIDLATKLYQRINWPWMLYGGETFSMGWTPENGFLNARWDTYSELMMLYLLAVGSPSYPVPASSWDAISRPTLTYENLTYITNTSAPLFIHQFSHAWFDFRNKQDAYTNYFNNSVIATQAHKLLCGTSLASQFSDYSDKLWGITASDSSNGYVVWGGPPPMGPIDGSIVPCAAGGSIPFLSADCIEVLRNMQSWFPRSWQRYSFVDAFNPISGWYDPDVIGIDLGIMMLMAENQRTGYVWETFMRNPECAAGMKAVGFVPQSEAKKHVQSDAVPKPLVVNYY